MVEIRDLGLSEVSKGTTKLLDGSDAQPVVNIIFVHGLSGHPRRTWESCPPSKDDKTNKNTKTKHKAFHFPHFSLGRRRDRNTFGLADESNASSSGSYRVFWPGDLLLEDIPNARIFTYGYRADVVGTLYQPSNQNSIYEHTKDFIAKLSREVEEDTLPIIFVAHSLGGVIVKDA